MWYSWISDAFPVHAMVLIAIVLGGFICFDGVIRDKVNDIKEEINAPSVTSEATVKVPVYVPEEDDIVYKVSLEDGRLSLI